MKREQLSESLNGSYIVKHDFDMWRNRLVLQIDALYGGILSHYDVQFWHISRLVFRSEEQHDQSGEFELTELWIEEVPEKSASGEWQVTISSYDVTHLEITCASILVNGEPLP